MLNYVGFLYEKRDHRGKIKKFANVDQIYDWAHKLDSDLSLWIADKVVKTLKSRINEKDKLQILEKYLETGEVENPEYLKAIRSLIGKVKSALSPKIRKVLDYVNSPLHLNKPNINKLSLKKALKKSEDWHEEIKNSSEDFLIEEEDGDIIMTFENGYYWINLQSTSCSDEASAMGHCGNTNKGSTILSLRRYKQPHVTISWEESDNVFYQIKGKGNDKPVEKYHRYIVDLICKLEIEGYRSEYDSENDFSPDDLEPDFYQKLQDCNPKYIENQGFTDEEIEDKYRQNLEDGYLEEMIEMGYFDGNYLFYYVDDDAFLESMIDDETQYYAYDNFSNYEGQEDELRSWILDKLSEEDLEKILNSNIEDDLIEIKDDWGFDEDEEYEEGELDDLNDLIEERKDKSYEDLLDEIDDFDQLEQIMDENDIKESFVKDDLEDRWSNAEDYYNSMYGNSDSISGKEFMNIFGSYFDESGMIDRLVQDMDVDDERENYE